MLLTIAIIAAIGYIISFFKYLSKDEFGVNLPIAAILTISTWESCLPLAIIVLVITCIIIRLRSTTN